MTDVFDNFKPPPPPTTPPYATYIPDRDPKFKVHSRLSLAKTALTYDTYGRGCRGGIIYELNKTHNEWFELIRVAPGTEPKDLPWRK